MKKLLAGILALFMCISFVGCASNNSASSSSNVSSENKPQDIYSDNLIIISSLKKSDSQLQGMFSIDVIAENKSDEEITVYLQDVYLNEAMVTVGSGVPLDILPKKSKSHSFVGKYEGTGITTANEIKKIGFKIIVMDKSAKTLETTKAIEINF